MNWKCYSFLPLPLSSLSTLRTANCHQVDAESSIHENLEWIPLDDASTPVIQQIFSGFVSHPRCREYSRCIHRIAIENRGKLNCTHTYLWFVETKCAARSGRNWFQIAAVGWRACERDSLHSKLGNAFSLSSAWLLSIRHWIEIFTVRFPNRFQSKRVTRTLPPINKDELRRFGEKYFMKRARHEVKTVVSAQRASFGERTLIYCDSSASPETFLVVIRTDDSGCYRQPWSCKVMNVLIAAYQLTPSLSAVRT